MKLYTEDDPNGQAIEYLSDSDQASSEFTISIDPTVWNLYIDRIDVSYLNVRNEMIDQFEPNWASYSADQKRDLIENYIWPSETSVSELDDLYDPDIRDTYQAEVMVKMNTGMVHVIKSPSSTKHFVVTVDDGGALIDPLPEIKTDTKI